MKPHSLDFAIILKSFRLPHFSGAAKRPQFLLRPMILAFAAVLITLQSSAGAATGFSQFITAREGRLYEGTTEFRFISFNIPNLTYTEDDMRFERLSFFRLPTAYEIDDALATIQQMGGRVARTYTLSVKKSTDPVGLPRHILGPGQLNEEAMRVLDQVLETANRRGVRLIIPLIDQNSWWGGIEEFAGFRGKSRDAFWTDPQIKADYKDLVRTVLTRVNTRTGVSYLDDKAVLAWELGNELQSPKEWVAEMAPYFKQVDPHHLVAESYFTDAGNAGVDIVQDHLYQGDPVKMLEKVRASSKLAAGKRVYLVGEFGFVTTEGMRSIIDETIQDPNISGALIWSLRFHNQDGGYYWHHEPFGGDFFKAYHWPGGPAGQPYDEWHFMHLVRAKAFEIRKIPIPNLTVPSCPEIISVTDGGVITWRGATGAASYDLQHKPAQDGRWTTIGFQLTDDAAQYRPLAVDGFAEPGQTYSYRMIARNERGLSKPSRTFGPVSIRCRTIVDELVNLSQTYRSKGKLELRSNEARNFKEDCHRLAGAPGAWVAYHVTGQISGVRVFAFGEKAEPGLQFRAADEGGKGEVLPVKTKDYYAGKEMYDLRPPRLYQIESARPGISDLVIEFTKDTQISRIEIDYR